MKNLNQLHNQSLVSVIDAFPGYVLILDRNGTIVATNKRANDELQDAEVERYGDIIKCKYSVEGHGCGNATYCEFCEIKQMVDAGEKQVLTREIVREVMVFDELVIKKYTVVVDHNLAEDDLSVVIIMEKSGL
ncbi:MAG: hypothetical protein C0593_00790 [Marinilabiliales bacterium]|nr:MAG: hypothetical protein C0593_00790 [Marinilabiliales bacterium]